MLVLRTFVSAAALFAAQVLLGQATITGRLYAPDTEGATPLHQCPVFAQSIENGPLVAEYPDAEGRFRLVFPPDPRVSIGVLCHDYRLVSLDDDQPPIATFDCSQVGLCTEIQLNLERLGAIDGFVVGPLGNPLENVQIGLRSLTPGQRSRGRPSRTDDRGYFRFFHLPAGEYELHPLPSRALREGIGWEGDPVRLTLENGKSITGLQVPMRLVEGVPVRGRAVGLPSGTERVRLQLISVGERFQQSISRHVMIDEEGRFRLPEVSPGRYRATLFLESRDAGETRQIWRAGFVDVDSSGSEIILEPFEPATLRGQITVVWPNRDDLPFDPRGADIHINLRPKESGDSQHIRVAAPEYQFEQTGMVPGEYRVSFGGIGHSPRAEILAETGEWEPLETIRLSSGGTQEVNMRLSFEIGRLTVLVKPPKGASPSEEPVRYIVGLRRGERIRLFPTDQYGRLVIDFFTWGEYEICAFAGINLDEARDPKTWEAAGDAVLPFEHSEGADMEITLNAAP